MRGKTNRISDGQPGSERSFNSVALNWLKLSFSKSTIENTFFHLLSTKKNNALDACRHNTFKLFREKNNIKLLLNRCKNEYVLHSIEPKSNKNLRKAMEYRNAVNSRNGFPSETWEEVIVIKTENAVMSPRDSRGVISHLTLCQSENKNRSIGFV